MPKDINDLIMDDKYDEAVKLIRKELKKEPSSHWLYAQLSSCYYEKFQYKKALMYSTTAMALSSKCPMVLWHHAGVLEVLGKKDESLKIYKRLVKRGVENIAYGECGEGPEIAKGLVNDCRYRIGCIYLDRKNYKRAKYWFLLHLKVRKHNRESIYTKKEVESCLKKCL